jgi:hypothetical protein
MISRLRAPHCVFCAFGCGLLFGLWFFLFSSLVPLPSVFPFIYLFNNEPQLRGLFPATYQDANSVWFSQLRESTLPDSFLEPKNESGLPFFPNFVLFFSISFKT